MSLRQVTIDILLWLGVGLCMISCVGVLLMRDAYDRLHFSAPATLASLCIGVAVMVKEGFSAVSYQALLIAVLLLVACPVLTHLTGRAVRVAEHGDWHIRSWSRAQVEGRER